MTAPVRVMRTGASVHKRRSVPCQRRTDVSSGRAKVELGEGVYASCRISESAPAEEAKSEGKADLSSLSSMLAQKWKSGPSGVSSGSLPPKPKRSTS